MVERRQGAELGRRHSHRTGLALREQPTFSVDGGDLCTRCAKHYPLTASPLSHNMGWLDRIVHRHPSDSGAAPPVWSAAPEQSHGDGMYTDATQDSFAAGESFCSHYPVEAPRLLPSDVVERVRAQGCAAWGLSTPHTSNFVGRVGPSPGNSKLKDGLITVETADGCDDTCLFSDLPIMAGLYADVGKEGVYFEVTVLEMSGTIAVGECSTRSTKDII
jgi:hypothetical protein